MDNPTSDINFQIDEDRIAQRKKRQEIRRQRERKRRRRLIRSCITLFLAIALFIGILILIAKIFDTAPSVHPSETETSAESTSVPLEDDTEEEIPTQAEKMCVQRTASTKYVSDELSSEFAVVIDADTGNIIADKNSDAIINPASMTKILTILVAAEHITNWDSETIMTDEIGAICFKNDCSVVGYEVNEPMPIRDLLYGTILPSGADASMALALYTCGSLDTFVALMNEKIDELGLSSTCHFTNCVGLFDDNHYCTLQDMAIILQAALQNEICHEVLTTKVYTTTPNTFHEEGMVISNWFLRRIEDKDTGNIDVLAAKTGYVKEAGSCAASYAERADGHGYFCVTGNADGSWPCIYDHVKLYKDYCAS